MIEHDITEAASVIAGPGSARTADQQRDAIDDVVPRLVVEPDTEQALAATLAWAADRGLSTVIRGAGTKLGWGRVPDRVDLVVSTRRLHRLLSHEHGDLTATIEAGASIGDVNRALAAHGQWLPLDSSFGEDATIGGLIATNDAGPYRHRYGTPRDLVIGTRIATPAGTISKSGGRVVKNVAGYDLSRLLAGSFGSLAAIVSATFKLAPLPAASKTLVALTHDPAELARWVQQIAASQLEPVAADVDAIGAAGNNGPVWTCALLVRFATVASAVDAQVTRARDLVGPAASSRVLSGDAERAAWDDQARRTRDDAGVLLKLSWLPATLEQTIAELGRTFGTARIRLSGRASVGAGFLQVEAPIDAQVPLIERLRDSTTFGNVVIVRAPGALKQRIDVWPSAGGRQRLFESLKQTFDPYGILNPGRGPL